MACSAHDNRILHKWHSECILVLLQVSCVHLKFYDIMISVPRRSQYITNIITLLGGLRHRDDRVLISYYSDRVYKKNTAVNYRKLAST